MWTDELKAQVIKSYQDAEPTPENSVEIVNEIAEEIGASPNGVRMILSKAGVYIAKDPKAAKAKSPAKAGTSTRVSKESAIQGLREALEAADKEVNEEIISKLTGKAAVYFTEILK